MDGWLYLVNSVPAGSGQPALTYRYGYNDAGQRVTLQMPDGSGWRYQYDALGQLVLGRRYWPDGTAVAGQQFEYGFALLSGYKSLKTIWLQESLSFISEGAFANS